MRPTLKEGTPKLFPQCMFICESLYAWMMKSYHWLQSSVGLDCRRLRLIFSLSLSCSSRTPSKFASQDTQSCSIIRRSPPSRSALRWAPDRYSQNVCEQVLTSPREYLCFLTSLFPLQFPCHVNFGSSFTALFSSFLS